MPRLPHLPPGTRRFFGRIDRFTCECPRCGQILRAQLDQLVGQVRRTLARQAKAAPRPRAHSRKLDGSPAGQRLTYNPLTSRLVCPQCGQVFGVGLLLYPVRERDTGQQPYDQRPTYKQLLALRELAGGFFIDKPIVGSDSMNIAVEGTCLCDWKAETLIPCAVCPVHGWEEQLRGKTWEEQQRMEATLQGLGDARETYAAQEEQAFHDNHPPPAELEDPVGGEKE